MSRPVTVKRRTLLKHLSAGAGSLVFAPFLQRLEAQEKGTYALPRRVVFVVFGNGFHEDASIPQAVSFGGEQTRQLPLDDQKLPFDIEPFTPYKDRLAIVHGLRAGLVNADHGAGFGALSGLNGGVGDDRKRNVVGESIDAAIARKLPGIFPLLVLGIDPGKPETNAYLCSSAWGAGQPIAAQCRPELAYESLFGGVGAKKNDFAVRKNLLDFIATDIKDLQSHLTSSEREQLDYHLHAMESLSKRDGQLAEMYDQGLLKKSAPALPSPFPVTMTDTATAQFDIAASALMTGLTNVVTITSELCTVRGAYTGISTLGSHAVGHNNKDPKLDLPGLDILRRVRRHLSEQTASMLRKLDSMPEGNGTMLDNTLVVFMSDGANRQHTHGENWPFALIGNLGGRIKGNQLVTYPMREAMYGTTGYRIGTAPATNPTINAMYNTLLHAVGAPREHFNLLGTARENPALRGPLPELLS
ncbi:DUF1552 domain-containing protein [Lignipirellula cremea]|uniref:DUF1552 domain-containing protein n=1 Tax=Lignipirellula cremea TaxID=2528010 RepID=A0A518DM55_9BACT|nr:DUF1552 domain-containing protein [Lignipirellula cremea]QDU92915.1 hypothetical protein Pla8534_06880 [Lignipirellula cremea]